ncbi:putative septum site-determining protein MinC [Deinococcus seoulensis]|uniref:Septum site-determining protein MinC n=1 Tax=Deinococcus seoulensis TaxID=1837379 RepID=A0ABQ2RN98_9DEIO|nr:septum site-determining protein MinC [Deinococcus seoulensis]GGR44113.1 putative septum site-determining protein MinC [Deinococcus seoulensis]
MKLRGTLGGMNLLLEPTDTAGSVAEALGVRAALLTGQITLELQSDVDPAALEEALLHIRAAGGTPGRVRAARQPAPPAPTASAAIPAPTPPTLPAAAPAAPAPAAGLPGGRTVIVPHTLRAGFRGEYPGSVIVLGDVNPGAEVMAGGDVIVIGALRGLAHAGQGGHSDAIVWARPIASPQLRIGNAVARAPEGSSLSNMRHREDQPTAEVARLHAGTIQIDTQK